MRRYWLPLSVCTLAGVGILIVVFLNRRDEGPVAPGLTPKPGGAEKTAVKEDRWGQMRDTLVSTEEFIELSELERALQREDKHGVAFYADRVDLERSP